MKFSLLTLLGAVAIAAVGCAALANPGQTSAMAVVTGAIVLLLSAVLAAIYCKAAVRAFWLGFAICGWSYLLLVWVCLERELTPDPNGRILATAWILDKLADATIEPQALLYSPYADTAPRSPDATRYAAPSNPYAARPGRQPASAVPVPTYQGYSAFPGTPEMSAWRCLLQIGHTLWALLFGFAGGVLGCHLHRRGSRRGDG
jgi:hypothetical protein